MSGRIHGRVSAVGVIAATFSSPTIAPTAPAATPGMSFVRSDVRNVWSWSSLSTCVKITSASIWSRFSLLTVV